jgi:hypothetical protein
MKSYGGIDTQCVHIKYFQNFTMICRKPHMASSNYLRATIFQNPGGTLWTHCIDAHLLTSALAGGEWSASRLGRFTPDSQWIGGWVNPRAGLDDMEKRKSAVFLTL